jgi:hypothetical protein
MKILMLFLIMTLTGCGEITSEQIKKAEELCKNNGGILRIHSLSTNTPTIICTNAARFDFK